MNTAIAFEGRALSGQDVSIRRGGYAAASSPAIKIIPAAMLFLVLAAQLMVRVMVTERAYEIESLRTAALGNDAELRELRARHAELHAPTAVTERVSKELGFRSITPQQIRKFVFEK